MRPRSLQHMRRRAERLSHQGQALARLGKRRLQGRKLPYQVTFSLTNRCNFRCAYCAIPLHERDELDTAAWIEIIDEFVDAGLGRASLIGGEPLLRPDAGEIIHHLRRRHVHTAMNTNGWYVADRMADVAQLDLVNITLDGPPEVHDKQRRKGSHARVIDALDRLHRAGVPVVTMTVVTPAGLDKVDHVLEVARTYGHRAWFQLEHHRDFDVSGPVGAGMGAGDIAGLCAHLLRRKRDGWPVGNSEPVLRAQMRDGDRIGGDCSGCFAGRYTAYVLSDGSVAPCLLTRWQAPRGNGLTQGMVPAFEQLAPPTGPGCACVPSHEVNALLSLDPSVVFSALAVARPWRLSPAG